MLLCIINTMFSLYCEFFFIHEQIKGHTFCQSLRSVQWQSPINTLVCSSRRYNMYTILHTITAVILMICGITASFYIKDYKEQQYQEKKRKEQEEDSNHQFSASPNETYQADAVIDFEGATSKRTSSVRPGDVDFSQITYS